MALCAASHWKSALALASLIGAVIGCGNSSNSNGAAKTPTARSSSSAQTTISSAAASSVAVTTGRIKLNQLGFLPEAAKWALVPAGQATSFHVISVTSGDSVLSGNLSLAATWAPAEDSVKRADFSALKTPGDYMLRVDGATDSYPFRVATDTYRALTAASIKAFYFNRNSAELLAAHAGEFARLLGHPDTEVLVHASAASDTRPTGTVISSPKGWYDAGDYNKYIVNSGISTYSLLAAYEHFPQIFQNQSLNIPESGNSIPDLLDEALWNLEWMQSMQDPHDGGVYHKLTNKHFDGLIMPHQARTERYVVQKTTAATLNFAAVMAVASRVFANYDAQLPGLSAKMLAAAESAWAWAAANPAIAYKQPSDITTGEYGDNQFADEFSWAAAELYITSKQDAYYVAMKAAETTATIPSWNDVRSLAWMSLAHHRDNLTPVADTLLIARRIDNLAANLHAVWAASAYGVTLQKNDFVWGSNSVALGQAMMLLQGYRLNSKRGYLDAAQSTLDYLLGRNATDTSFVTGYGDKTPQHPHHRTSEADGIAKPIPGFIVGGPQPGQQDKKDCLATYPSSIPAKSYLDDWCSYASNEVAINWNAALVYVSAAIEALTPQ